MTPDLMKAGAQARIEHEKRLAITQGSSGGRVASYGSVVNEGELDVKHGAILYLDDITVSFDGFKALNALSLSISAGELRCIIGPNGAGKTTMMDVITGKTRPDVGKAFFGSTIDLLRLRENEIASVGIGRKFQKPTVFEHLTVFENLELALKADRGVRASMFFRLSGEQLDRIGAPSNSMLPLLIGTRPISDLSSVVLPTPLRPSTTVTSPSFASKPKLRRMCEPP